MYLAFCFSCSWTRYSEPLLRRRSRPCAPGGKGRRSSALRPLSFSKMLVPRRREVFTFGPGYRAICQRPLVSDPAPLGLAAAVVGHGRDVLDGRHLDAGFLDRSE